MAKIKKILCALDLSQHSETVADYATTIAKAVDAELVVVYVAPALAQYVGFHVPPSSIENFVGEISSGAEKAMADFMDKHFSNIKAKGVVLNGYAADEILAAADTYKADMIVMGTHGRRGVDRLLFGSVAENVVKTALIPVMTLRPQDK